MSARPALAPEPAPRLLNSQEVANLLAVSRRTVRRLTEGGHLPAYRFATKTLRWDRAGVLAYLDACRVGVSAEALRRATRELEDLRQRQRDAHEALDSHEGAHCFACCEPLEPEHLADPRFYQIGAHGEGMHDEWHFTARCPECGDREFVHLSNDNDRRQWRKEAR